MRWGPAAHVPAYLALRCECRGTGNVSLRDAGQGASASVRGASAPLVRDGGVGGSVAGQGAWASAGRQYPVQYVDPVGDYSVYAQVEEFAHLLFVVDRPDMYLLAERVGSAHET